MLNDSFCEGGAILTLLGGAILLWYYKVDTLIARDRKKRYYKGYDKEDNDY